VPIAPVEDPAVAEQVEIRAKYAGYIIRQSDEIERIKQQEQLRLPDDLEYAEVRGLSKEVAQVLSRQRPETVGQAGRLPGVTPAAVSLLLVHLKRRRDSERTAAARPVA
jgi:tRNA uridine 5-carboxymethylaminomethyl modification enzyme